MKSKMNVTLILSLIGLMILSACSNASAATPSPEATVLPAVRNSNLIIADGKVIPEQYTSLSFKTSGVVAEIKIAEGQSVTAGQEIAYLSGAERLQAEIAAAELEVLTTRQERQTLLDQADLHQAQAAQTLAAMQKELDKATKQAASKEYKVGNQEQVDIAWANLITAQEDVKHWEEQWGYVDEKDESDPQRASVLSALAAARQVRDQAQANYNFLISKPSEIEVNLANANLALAQQNVVSAQAEVERLSNGADVNKLNQLDAQIKSAEARLAAAQAALSDLTISAPFDGEVVNNPLKVGELVNPGNPLVVVANLDHFMVETTDLTEINVLGVQPGDEVIVYFDAIPSLKIPGTVERVRQIGNFQQGDITYTVLVNLSQQDPRLMWNMTASVEFGK